jgi:hypothetical protein
MKMFRTIVYLSLVSLILAGCATTTASPTQQIEATISTSTAGDPAAVTVLPDANQAAQVPAASGLDTPVDLLPVEPAGPSQTYLPIVSDAAPITITFAVIGDYGNNSDHEADVAALVDSWQPDLVLTTGDNNYPDGEESTIDGNIGKYYRSYIFPYLGDYGDGADSNSFFPTPGNNDWEMGNIQPYLDYFALPGNERYYDFTWGPVHFFALDNDPHDPDGADSSSAQAQWLKEHLATSTSPWQVVYMHFPAYSSSMHGPTDWAQWPYAEWGADLVMAGHDHTYERLLVDGMPYIVNGLGGASIYDFEEILPQSVVRFNTTFGALWVEAGEHKLSMRFISIDGETVDSFEVTK